MPRTESQSNNWTKHEVKEKFQKILFCLIKQDSFLLTENTNERSITHMLAMYLAKEFPHYHVDCEYNRKTSDSGEQVKKEICDRTNPKSVAVNDIDARTVFPDIIIHHRENNENNLLVIEVKKKGADKNWDYAKLNAYARGRNSGGLGYNFSALVILDTKSPEASQFEVKDQTESWVSL